MVWLLKKNQFWLVESKSLVKLIMEIPIEILYIELILD